MVAFYARPNRVLTTGIILSTVLFLLLKNTGSPSRLHLDGYRITSARSDILDDVLNQTLGFQKIFVISLPYRTDQRDAMTLAASLTDLAIEFVDGVSEVHEKALPDGAAEAHLSKGAINNWRAHMDVISKIVAQNLTSALVLEGDVDWDVRIKTQMRSFARASSLLLQPLTGTTDRFLDPSCPVPSAGQTPQNLAVDDAALRLVTPPSTSPYGDLPRWDMLWLGHCGAFFPVSAAAGVPMGRAVLSDDATVPEIQHLNTQFGGRELLEQYEDHTRVVSRARDMTCTLAYAVSRPGARRLLHEAGGIRGPVSGATDMIFRSVCEGTEGRGRAASCLTVQPQLFQHHRPAGLRGRLSDIENLGGEGRNERAFTRNVRWSARLNLHRLLDGGEGDYVDLFPDDAQSPAWLEP